MNDRVAAKASSQRLPWVMAPVVLPWLAGLEWGWWRVFRSELLHSPVPGGGFTPAMGAGVGVIGKMLGHLSEAAFYVLLWRARGARLPFWRFAAVVVSASLADQLAYALSAPFAEGGAPAWRACVAGLHLADGTVFHDSPAVRAGFGSLGLLTAARIGITAAAQAQATGRRWTETVGWTVLTWLLTRLAALWGVDLMRGVSPIGAG